MVLLMIANAFRFAVTRRLSVPMLWTLEHEDGSETYHELLLEVTFRVDEDSYISVERFEVHEILDYSEAEKCYLEAAFLPSRAAKLEAAVMQAYRSDSNERQEWHDCIRKHRDEWR